MNCIGNAPLLASSRRQYSLNPQRAGLVILAVCLTGTAVPARADYTYDYNGGRIIQQSQTGLQNPSSSYITGGTLSKSARGEFRDGPQTNPGLPRVNHGSVIGTPGDNQYTTHPINALPPPPKPKPRIAEQPVQVDPNKPKQYIYVPGQNESDPALQSNYSGGSGSGTFTYKASPYESGSSTSVSASPKRNY